MGESRVLRKGAKRGWGIGAVAAVVGIAASLVTTAPAMADTWQDNVSCSQQCRIGSSTGIGVTQHYHSGHYLYYNDTSASVHYSYWKGAGSRSVMVLTSSSPIYWANTLCQCITQPCSV